MAAARSLSSAYASGANVAPEDREELLACLVARGSSAWPDIAITPTEFVEYLGRRVPVSELSTVHAEDLWIACGAASGDTAAIAKMEAHYLLVAVDRAIRKMNLGNDRTADVMQMVRNLLFVADGTTAPRIADYRGSGELRAWLRITAMRLALKLLRKDRHETTDDAVLEAQAPQADPERVRLQWNACSPSFHAPQGRPELRNG